MALFSLESLVLRGVSVVSDGKAGELRRGTSYATGGAPEIQVSMRHQPGWSGVNPPAKRPEPAVDDREDPAVLAASAIDHVVGADVVVADTGRTADR